MTDNGKSPGKRTPDGWVGVSVNEQKFRCHDRATAELWASWNANAGFVAGDGYIALDNDQGEPLGGIIARVCREVLGPEVELLRRFVASPGHKRDAYLLRVVEDFIGPAAIANQSFKFECSGITSELQVLGRAKQLVVAGEHPRARAPYVLSKRVTSLADIPVVTPEQFDRIIEGVVAGMEAAGWALVSGGRAGAGPGTPPGAAGAASSADVEDVVWILERLPNRDVESDKATEWDKLLDDYHEYIKIVYAIIGALGATPEAMTIWLEWANGRAQHPSNQPEAAWASAASNPVRSGIGHLRKLAKQFIGAEYTARGFPDPTPEEQAEYARAEKETRKSAWDHLREALRWSGMEAALAGNSNIARDEFGSAMIGKGASSAPPMARQWITDRHVRGRVSMLSAMPEAGKTILDVGYAHAIATERPSLVGLSEIDRHGAVAIIALDNERADEFDLKGRAFRRQHGLWRDDFKHEIYVIEDCGPLVERQPGGDLGPSRGIIALAPKLAWLREHEDLCLIIIDTMLGAAGGADTSEGPAMSVIMQVAKMIAETLNSVADLINHLTKGGAARDPDSMDAALGARSASATPRFMTHLKKEGGLVRVTQAKRSYMGPSGCLLYEFKSVDIASTRPEDPTRTVTENVGILVPAAKSAMTEAFAAEDAHQALWEAHDKQKVKIKRGSRKTVRGPDHASMIIEDAGVADATPLKSRRAEAERLLAVLIKDGRLKVVKEWLGRHQVEVVVPEEPEELV